MKIQHLTAWDDGKRVTRLALLLADHSDPSKRTEWLECQLPIDLPITRNGALLREELLKHIAERLSGLAAEYGRLVRPE
jgi:hypothetical protein